MLTHFNMVDIKRKEVIFWDWNGTILNDAAICVQTMNQLLIKYHYPEISRKTYESCFVFPVSKYYQNIGWNFDKHPFSQVGLEFMDIYKKEVANAPLQKGVTETFKLLNKAGKQQYLISAMEHALLRKLTNTYGLHDYFESINGIENHYGDGKAHIFEKVIQQHNLERNNILMIGDTLHDAEIGQALGVDCLLFYSGHQSHSRISKTNFPVIHSYEDLNKYL